MSEQKTLTRWLWRDYLSRHVWLIALAILLMALEGSMLGALSYIVKPMFDKVLVAKNSDAVIWVGLAVLSVFVIRALATYGHRVIMVTVGERIAAALQSDLVRHMLTLDGSFFQDHPPGTLIERTRGDSLVAAEVWKTVFAAFGRDTVGLISLMAVAFWIDWRWTLIAMAGAPLLMLPVTALQRFVRTRSRSARAASASASTRLDEIFHGATTIKLSGTETREAGRFSNALMDLVHAKVSANKGQSGIPALTDIVAGLGFFGVLVYGGHQIIAGEKSVGDFMAFFTAIGLVFEPLRRLGNVAGIWQAALASFERIHEIFLMRPTIVSPPAPQALKVPADKADIVLDGVEFAYGDAPVLRGTTFTAEAGKTTAFVGASGAGKSTIFNLLTRLADVDKGRIAIGGTAVSDLKLEELRGLFSVVSQDALLFDESLRDNITMGEDVEAARLDAALKAAHVADFLPKLSNGIDTPAGPRGSALSGGQRQRVAIARAILRDRPILLLDEATSALDAQSEKVVQAALEDLSKGRTTLVIAHRLSTIRDADKIVVMDQGRVVDQGTHGELLDRGGIYADLYRLQFSDGKTITDPRNRGQAGSGRSRKGNGQDGSNSAPLGAASRWFDSVSRWFGRAPR